MQYSAFAPQPNITFQLTPTALLLVSRAVLRPAELGRAE
jgi:hypothetical protein